MIDILVTFMFLFDTKLINSPLQYCILASTHPPHVGMLCMHLIMTNSDQLNRDTSSIQDNIIITHAVNGDLT